MTLRLSLWQRIFLHALVLVLASLFMGFFINRAHFAQRGAGFALGMSSEILSRIDGEQMETVQTLLAILNRHFNKIWLEDEAGELVAGQRFNELTGGAWQPHLRDEHTADNLSLWKTDFDEPHYLLIGRLTIDGRRLTYYHAFAKPPRPPFSYMIAQWLAFTLIIGGLLSLWMARRVSRPLIRLEKELSELRKSKQLGSVTVTGNDEIAAVATALNDLMASLAKHVAGMRELVVNISHELRSPLARMTLSADLIGRGLFVHPLPRGKGEMTDDALQDQAAILLAKKHFASLQEELEHMDKLIGETLLNSKLDLRSPDNLTESVNLSRLCLGAVFRHEPLFQEADINLAHDVEPDLLANGDKTLLLQLLSNLFDNALKYTRFPGATVMVRLQRRKTNALLTVENPCEPLPQEILEHIFEPFFRYGEHLGQGTGLGLSLVHKIAALHRGDAMAVSTEYGVCLCVQIPLVQEASSPPGESVQ